MLTAVLTVFVLASALLAVRAEHLRRPRQVYVFKPLTTILIILVALGDASRAPSFYRYAVLCGLLASLAGDVFLMLPSDRFLEGLASFLAAHLCYVAAFTAGGARVRPAWLAVPLLLYGGLMLGLLWPRLGRLKLPVVVYTLAILLMAWQALGLWQAAGRAAGLLALAGALLFVASDTLLGWGRFRGEFAGGRALVLATYFAAQCLIALSA